MVCFHPVHGYVGKRNLDTGKSPTVFKRSDSSLGLAVPRTIPCGRCIGCRLERSRQWAVRCMHEASLYENNCFITLTYDDAHLPYDHSLNVRHCQLFMKRLRKSYSGLERVENSYPIRFFMCGEYGDQRDRPHYHACLFNFDFPDRELWSTNEAGNLYTSEILQELWPYGFSTIGNVTFDSAAYVARYIMKKRLGKDQADYYEYFDEITGVIYDRSPEFVVMSRRPGIAKGWFDEFYDEVYNEDFVLINGKRCKPPRFYDNKFDVLLHSDMEKKKRERRSKAKDFACDCTPERLRVREEVALCNLKMKTRKVI